MKGSRLFTVLLWITASVAILSAALAVVSATDVVRLAIISDNSSAPTAPNGALEIAVRTPANTVRVGDTVLVGAHADKGLSLGQVTSLNRSDGSPTVMLRGANRSMPDRWSYELGANTYKHVFAIPLVGAALTWGATIAGQWWFAATIALLLLAAIILLRYTLFAKPVKSDDRWFKHLDENDRDDITVLSGIFEERGLTPPTPYVRKRRGRNA